MRRRPRQADVARLAGVSPATVSVILNNRLDGTVRVSPETRQRVLEAVETLGYVTDPVARSLAGGRNLLLGVFTFESIFPLEFRDFYYPFLVGIEEEAERAGYDLLLFTSVSRTDGVRRIYNNGVNRLRLADGAILLGNEQNKEQLDRLLQEGYPFVFVGRRESNYGTPSYVAADYTAATATVITYLLNHGHRRIAYLANLLDTESQRDRRQGYWLALQQAQLISDPALFIRCSPETMTPGFLQRLLDQGVTALVTEAGSGNQMLQAAMRALGKFPPAAFSYAILGDPLTSFEMPFEATGFTIPRRAMGARAVQLLTEMLNESENQHPRQVTLPCTFVPGSTVATVS